MKISVILVHTKASSSMTQSEILTELLKDLKKSIGKDISVLVSSFKLSPSVTSNKLSEEEIMIEQNAREKAIEKKRKQMRPTAATNGILIGHREYQYMAGPQKYHIKFVGLKVRYIYGRVDSGAVGSIVSAWPKTYGRDFTHSITMRNQSLAVSNRKKGRVCYLHNTSGICNRSASKTLLMAYWHLRSLFHRSKSTYVKTLRSGLSAKSLLLLWSKHFRSVRQTFSLIATFCRLSRRSKWVKSKQLSVSNDKRYHFISVSQSMGLFFKVHMRVIDRFCLKHSSRGYCFRGFVFSNGCMSSSGSDLAVCLTCSTTLRSGCHVIHLLPKAYRCNADSWQFFGGRMCNIFCL